MKKYFILASVLLAAAADVNAQSEGDLAVPERAVILSGGQNGVHQDVLRILYDTHDVHFQDPDFPRYLLIDREGTTLFGIGGYVEGIAQYDFDGAIDNDGFATADISVPLDPSNRNRLGADATHTNLVMRLLRYTKLGVLNAYVQGNFSGDHYGFKLKQAYVQLGHVTGGLARSTFEDPLAGPPTIDYQGPAGAVSKKNLLVRYRATYGNHFTWAASVEMPVADYTTDGTAAKEINQRVPDIPAYVQYQWDGGKSHVRASGIFRQLSYRDNVTAKNHFVTGWGVQLSGAVQFLPSASLIYQGYYGKGVGTYINDLSEMPVDLIPDATVGKLKAPGSMGITGGVKIDLSKDFFVSSSYSLSRLYDQQTMGADAYRRGNYAVVNAFYTPFNDFQVGLEYLHGRRVDMDGSHGCANRLECMVKYSF